MIKYESFQYIFPPRPKNPIQASDLKMWDNGMMIAQPKLNGSNCTIYLNKDKVYVYNRHGQRLSNFNINEKEISTLYRGKGWMVLNGEYMNKSKKDSNGEVFNDKFCLFDLLVFDNNYLVGKTFQYRIDLMNNLFGQDKEILSGISENLFKIKSFYSDFEDVYSSLVEIDMYEGLVLKRKSAKLEVGSTENNNIKSQIKVRKPTKNYKY
jgi:ATP-dependent DNA ligase